MTTECQTPLFALKGKDPKVLSFQKLKMEPANTSKQSTLRNLFANMGSKKSETGPRNEKSASNLKSAANDNLYLKRSIVPELDCQKLSWHHKMYMRSNELNKKHMKNYSEIDDIKDFLYQNKLKMTKLNHSVDANI